MARSDRAVCSTVCGARCCKWGVVALTDDEAALLPRLAAELHLPQPRIIPTLTGDGTVPAMHSQPCVFLSKSNLCTIYKDRPGHCRSFPDTWREGCMLSWTLYGDGEALPEEHDRHRDRSRNRRAGH